MSDQARSDSSKVRTRLYVAVVDAMNGAGTFGYLDSRVHSHRSAMTQSLPIEEIAGSDLDDPILLGIESRRFGVKN